jgi:hypothetical protein
MQFTKEQFIYLLNILQHKGVANFESDWSQEDNFKDMQTASAHQLKFKNYKGNKKILLFFIIILNPFLLPILLRKNIHLLQI